MAGMSDYLENKLVDWLFRQQSFTPPTHVYVGLFTATPSDAGGGTEVSGGSYLRLDCGLGSLTSWCQTQGGTGSASNGTSGLTSNAGTLTFSSAPSANWGTVTHFGIFDAQTSGNLLFWAALTAQKTINSGDAAPSFAANALTVTLE